MTQQGDVVRCSSKVQQQGVITKQSNMAKQ